MHCAFEADTGLTVGLILQHLSCRELEAVHAADRPPLWGIPFAVKDNIDVAGFKTTAACKEFAYEPEDSAPAVQALLNAGASANTHLCDLQRCMYMHVSI